MNDFTFGDVTSFFFGSGDPGMKQSTIVARDKFFMLREEYLHDDRTLNE